MIPTSIDGTDITGATIDGTDVTEITVDGDTVFSAAPFTIVDGFNDSDFSEYSGGASLVNGSLSAAEGSDYVSTENVDFNISFPGDGLAAYPSYGDRFSALLVESSSTELPGFAFGAASNGDGWIAVIAGSTQSMRLFDNDGFTQEMEISISGFQVDEFYEVEVQWHDGTGSQPADTIEITVYEVDTSQDLSTSLARTSTVGSDTITSSKHQSNTGIGLDSLSSGESLVSGIDRIVLFDSLN